MDHADREPSAPGAGPGGGAATSTSPADEHAPRDRVLAACAYVGPGFLAPALMGTHTEFLRWHTAQGFVLFFLEALALAFLVLLDATIGRIPLLGLVVMLAARIGLLMLFVVVSAMGFVKALAGEMVELPWIGKHARRLPFQM